MSKPFKEIMVEELIRLRLRLQKANRQTNTYEKLQDEIRLDYLEHLADLNNEWDIFEISMEASEEIMRRTSRH